jgi:hypothetical protein
VESLGGRVGKDLFVSDPCHHMILVIDNDAHYYSLFS